MELDSKKVIEREIEGTKAALKAHREGVFVNEIVLEAFQKKLKKEKFK